MSSKAVPFWLFLLALAFVLLLRGQRDICVLLKDVVATKKTSRACATVGAQTAKYHAR
jgi:hypothetical protein